MRQAIRSGFAIRRGFGWPWIGRVRMADKWIANNRVIHIPMPAEDIEQWIGKMVDVEITEVLNYTLRGALLHTHVSPI